MLLFFLSVRLSVMTPQDILAKIIAKVSPDRMKLFAAETRDFAERSGQPIGNSQMELMRLHTIIAHLVEHADKFVMGDPPVAEKTPSEIPKTTETVAPLSAEAQARATALAKRTDHPPDLINVGTAVEGQITPAQHLARMEGMDEAQQLDYIDAMPSGTYAALTDGEIPPGG